MDLDDLRRECLSLAGTREDMPFGPDTLVFKVADKMFALLSLDAWPLTMNLKCDPDRALELRENYSCIAPGYHMNKKHWNTVTFNAELPPALGKELIRHSYELVVNALSAKKREELQKEGSK